MDQTALQQLKLFQSMEPAVLKSLLRYFRSIAFGAGEEIYGEESTAEYLYFILEGEVELSIELDENRSETICGLGPGEMFAIGEIFFDTYYTTAIARQKSRLLRIGRKDFLNHVLPLPEINTAILQDMARMVKFHVTRNKWATSRNTLLLFLINEAKKRGHETRDAFFFVNDLTHESIAGILNFSREHVTRLFRELKKENVLEVTKNTLLISKDGIDPVLYHEDIAGFRKF